MPRTSLATALLVLRAQTGSEEAFAALFREHSSATHRYLAALVGDDADDLQQELWVTVYRSMSELADPGAFRSWLFRAARHRAIDRLRRLRRERELFVDLDTEPPQVEQPAEPHWDEQALGKAIERLPPIHREAIVLRYHTGLEYGEIALATGVPVGTVRSRLHHAHRRLREMLNPGHPSGEPS
ncbi:MAG TPA: RNA polymerase sigma factor [Gemmatimonadales bacterium]|nr:RNA polymerase sigma factor [Gemmatimonadales bacterium]